MLNNKPMLAKELRDYIEAFLDTDDEELEEEEMYTMLRNTAECINDYLKTQPMTGRKFETGGTYGRFNSGLNVVSLEATEITKITPKSIFVKGSCCNYRQAKGIGMHDNEFAGSDRWWYKA